MKAATFQQGDSAPQVRLVDHPQAIEGSLVLKLHASAIHHLVRARALGKHYSTKSYSSRYSDNDHVIGVDGVGSNTETGQLYYFTAFESDNGSFGEFVSVDKENLYPIDGKISYDPQGVLIQDDVWDRVKRVAVLANSAMASYLALETRGFTVNKDSVVLINGVTGSSGQLAVDILEEFGVTQIIGIARNRNKLKPSLDAKLTEFIGVESVDNVELVNLLSKHNDIDVVIDFTWGDQALRVLQAIIKARKDSSHLLNWVQIGQIGGAEVAIPGGLLRSNNLKIMGSGIGAFEKDQGHKVFKKLVDDLYNGRIGTSVYEDIQTVSIDDINKEWIQWKPDSRKAFSFNKLK